MNITIQVQVGPGLESMFERAQDLSGILGQAGQAVADYLREYHGAMNWQGSNYLGGFGEFGQQVVEGWQDPVVFGNTVVITNTFGLLKHKVTGGTITPKRAQYLTIPLHFEARGKTVAEYRAEYGVSLFRAGMALCERLGGRLTAIYALRTSVHQEPWPGAMPTDEQLAGVFTEAIAAQLEVALGEAA